MKKILTFSLMTLLAVAGTAMAEETAGKNTSEADAPRPSRFEKYDTDNDNKLSSEEFAKAHPRLADKFGTIDENKDGFVTRDEMQAFRAELRAKGGAKPRRFDDADADKNGKLSKEEFVAAYPRLAEEFEKIDADKDGSLSREEMRDYRKQKGEARLNERFASADSDNDKKLSKEEFAKAFPKLEDKFDSLDTDKDGFVTKEEMLAAKEKRAEKNK